VQSELIHSAQTRQEMNSAKWINSRGTIHVNSVFTVHWTASDLVKKIHFFIVFYSKN